MPVYSLLKLAARSIFCKIIAGQIPSMKLYEDDEVLAFLGESPSYRCARSAPHMRSPDIGPIAKRHALVIPKYHAAKLHELPDEHLGRLLPVAKRLAIASGADEYNILQNNGRGAHQQVDHVHCEQTRPCVRLSSS